MEVNEEELKPDHTDKATTLNWASFSSSSDTYLLEKARKLLRGNNKESSSSCSSSPLCINTQLELMVQSRLSLENGFEGQSQPRPLASGGDKAKSSISVTGIHQIEVNKNFNEDYQDVLNISKKRTEGPPDDDWIWRKFGEKDILGHKYPRSREGTENGESNVYINGHFIPDRVVKKAKKVAGPIQPGEYWYDIKAGFWGVMGHPCVGIIPPNIEEFNYPMVENCAGGNTEVFVNGRELHQKDLDLLSSRGLPITKHKSYLIDISGKVVDEKSGEELDGLGKLAPTVEKAKRGFGMKIPKLLKMLRRRPHFPDSADICKEENLPRINKGGESFFVGLIKRCFGEFSMSSKSTKSEKSNVSMNGHFIPNRVVKKAEKFAGPIQPGKYWYDIKAGFWGVIGHPCVGIIPPNIEEFNYPMLENCAGGNTKVFVNGREFHQKDLDLLASRGLPITRHKSYFIDISGRVVDKKSGEELDGLGKLAPTVERVKHGFGMKIPKSLKMSHPLPHFLEQGHGHLELGREEEALSSTRFPELRKD
ncbi:hypothetical protein ACH5RR_038342 [Cinchona calisaya]|uniref:WRKY domain-containing protein n=1 Tax=Cinchona calisaya TaxID=153742 RepID=A0ABD2Y0R7_9GENT